MEMIPHQSQEQSGGPLARMMGAAHAVNAGAVAIESERAIAEARGQMQLAKMFPRSVTASITEFMDACRSTEFAIGAFYSVPNRGSGPSIRFAEEAARCYGNFEYGHRELSRSEGKSEIEVYAWDKEKNNRSTRQITVMHVIDTKNGPRKLTDQADIDNKIANVASKQIRGRILALMPKHMILAGISECKKTLAGNNEKPLRERILGVANAFAKYGITTNHLTQHLGHSLDDTTADELADLIGIGNAIKDGAKPSEYFDLSEANKTETAPQSSAAAAIASQVKKAAATTPKPKATPAPKAEAEETPKPEQSNPEKSESKPVEEPTPQPENNQPANQATDSAVNEEEGDMF